MSDTLLHLFSYDSATDTCFVDKLEQKPWLRFAARTFALSLGSANPKSPHIVSMALAMEAGERGWTKVFNRWAAKSHEIGEVDREFLDSPLFLAARSKLRKEEHLWAAAANFRREYEEQRGCPVALIWTAMEMR